MKIKLLSVVLLFGCKTIDHKNGWTAYAGVCDNKKEFYSKDDSLVVSKKPKEVYNTLSENFKHVNYKSPDSLNFEYIADLTEKTNFSDLKIKRAVYVFKIKTIDNGKTQVIVKPQLCAVKVNNCAKVIDDFIKNLLR
jgi:hypothetical protein